MSLKEYPLTMTQMGIFVESARHAGTTIYNIPLLYRLDERVDLERLQKAVSQAILAHPYLSMTLLRKENGDIRAIPMESPKADVPICDRLPSKEDIVRPFDLMSKEPLYRAEIYDTPEGKYFYLDIHHIIGDGASISIFMEDVNSAYDGKEIQKESWTGFDIGIEEKKLRASERYAKAASWYDSVCRGIDTATLPRKERESFKGADAKKEIGVLQYTCDADLEVVRSFCADNGLSENAFFTAAFGFALRAYCGTESAVFAAIYNGRNDHRTTRSVTMLVKTLPVVLGREGDKKTEVKTFISECQNWLVNAMANDIYSFAEIHNLYGLEADPLFAFQGEVPDEEIVGGYTANVEELVSSRTKAGFGLDILFKNGKICVMTEYDPSVYTDYTVEGFVKLMDHVITGFTVKKTLADISLINEEVEKHICNLYDTDFNVLERPAYRLLQDMAGKYPDRTALIAVDRILSYEELNAEANAVGWALITAGARPDSVVAVMAERNSMAYVMRQGILKSGAAFLPIDPTYPEERIRYIISDSGANIVVTTKAVIESRKQFFDVLSNEGVRCMDAEDLLAGDRSNPNIEVPYEALAYVIYTSGSTGKPKGVMLTNHNLVNFVDSNEKNAEILGYTDKGKVSLAIAALTFDFSIMEEFVPIANGLTVVLATSEQIMNPLAIAKLMLDNKVDIVSGTPSYISNLLEVPETHEAFAGVKSIDLGAEAFIPTLFDKLKALNPDMHIMNGYGPTETTISCSMEVIEDTENISIGVPNVNMHMATTDRDGRLQPLGATGEMIIFGDGVGRGYVKRPDLNEKSFFTLFGKKAYRSGDLVRIRKDGKIDFYGRIDNQVKLRGLRIELSEIESVLNAYPDVVTSIVTVIRKDNDEFLAAYYQSKKEIPQEDLKGHLSSYLTAYMVPQAFMWLEEMPLTANGKIDKKALPEINVARQVRVIKKPENDLQRILCEIYADALSLNEVGITENFFELGGTSLTSSMVLVSAMQKNLPIVFQDLYDAPSVAELETLIRSKNEGEGDHTDKDSIDKMLEANAKALTYNKVSYVDEISETPLQGVLLTGATGFLGIHILHDLLENTKETVYCLVREGKNTVKQRLQNDLFYYFDKNYEELFGTRIIALKGDITDMNSLVEASAYDFHTVINCAACVKHFAKMEILKGVNYEGVQNLIRMCLAKKARLIQTSTVSVAGDNVYNSLHNPILSESDLDMGQEVESNGYVYTKYLAEKAVLTAVEEDALDAKIIRMGNLMSRQKDGVFQMNFSTNNFMNTLRAYSALGCMPMDEMDRQEEFSPIDESARAVVLLSGTNPKFTVFHAYNSHTVEMGNVISVMNECGIPVEAVSQVEYSRRLKEGLEDTTISKFLLPLIAYSLGDDEYREEIPAENRFTIKALYRLHFSWPITDMGYIKELILFLKGVGFFDKSAE